MFLFSTPAHAQDVDALLKSMTLDQKVAQMFMISLYGAQLTDVGRDFLRRWQPGALALFGDNTGTPQAVTALTNAFQQTVKDAAGIPMFIATDEEGGIIATLGGPGFTQFPAPMIITATGDSQLAYRVGGAMAQELRAVGINMNLAPVADLNTNIDNPIIGRRSFGSDPELTGKIVAAVVRGLQDGGVLATAKHFPGHGDTDSDSHLTLPVVTFDKQHLERVELVPFRWTLAAGVESVMVAHIWYPALEPQPDLPASLSPNVIGGLLRGEMRYTGLVMTDALEMDAIDTTYSYGEASVMAVQAGVDEVVFGGHTGLDTQASAIRAVITAVKNGVIPESRIDESVRRILAAKVRYGVLNWQPLDPATAARRIDLQAHADLLNEVFRAGTTLAYDRNHALPLLDEKKIAMIYPANRSQIERECGTYKRDIRWLGVSDSPTDQEIEWAQSAARGADSVVVFTQNAYDNARQQALVRALPSDKTIDVALASPYDWLKFPDVSAYMLTYSPLQPAVPAACAILFGAAPARGVLAVSLGDTLHAGTTTAG
jgi:beta-N-acetylhexosaminidase